MAAKRALNIALIPGDGIGKEVIPAAARLLSALQTSSPLTFTFATYPAGYSTFLSTGSALPTDTLSALSSGSYHGALFGAVSSPSRPTPGYSSPIVALRKALRLHANVRPVAAVPIPGAPPLAPAHAATDLVIVRENTEDLYVKEERTYEDARGKVAEATKRITEAASARIARTAGEIALRRAELRGKTRRTGSEGTTASESSSATTGAGHVQKQAGVTITHKSNVLSQTDGLFRSTCLSVLSAPEFAPLAVSEQIVDSMAYKLFRTPGTYDVVVAPNLYGDIVSDAAAALVGSLGLVPSANVGSAAEPEGSGVGEKAGFVMGEPCHGSAPDIEGKGVANPIAAMRSAGVMLEFLGEAEAAARVYAAVDASLREGRFLTPDLGGKAGTEEVVEDVLKRL